MRSGLAADERSRLLFAAGSEEIMAWDIQTAAMIFVIGVGQSAEIPAIRLENQHEVIFAAVNDQLKLFSV